MLGHSGAAGVFLRSGAQAGILAQVRDRLPRLREVITLGEWPAGDGPLPEVDPASPAQILYTSGTTGRPKAAVLTHRGLTNNARLAAEAIGLRAGDVMVNPMPYFHVAGCGLITLGLVQTLGTQVVLPRFDPGRMLELTERYRGTVIGGVPTMLTALLAAACPGAARPVQPAARAGRRRDRAARTGPAGRGGVRGPVHAHVRADGIELLDHDDAAIRHGR